MLDKARAEEQQLPRFAEMLVVPCIAISNIKNSILESITSSGVGFYNFHLFQPHK
jgi:hypothetical protein